MSQSIILPQNLYPAHPYRDRAGMVDQSMRRAVGDLWDGTMNAPFDACHSLDAPEHIPAGSCYAIAKMGARNVAIDRVTWRGRE